MTGPDGDSHGGYWHWLAVDPLESFEGELLASHAPYREVTTERMIGMPGQRTVNELTLTPVSGGTLLALVITFSDSANRDAVLETGMAEGMEANYARLESAVLGRQDASIVYPSRHRARVP